MNLRNFLMILAVGAILASLILLDNYSKNNKVDFGSKIDSLTKVNNSLLAQVAKSDSSIANFHQEILNLQKKVDSQQIRVIRVRDQVKQDQGKVDKFDSSQLVTFYNSRYPADTVTRPLKVAEPVLKSAAKDLVAYDGTVKELEIKDSILTNKDSIISKKDSVITLQNSKELNYKNIIMNKDTVISLWDKQYTELNLQYNKLKKRNKTEKIITSTIIGLLTFGLIIK